MHNSIINFKTQNFQKIQKILSKNKKNQNSIIILKLQNKKINSKISKKKQIFSFFLAKSKIFLVLYYYLEF
jgi:hypothetical protein